MILIDSHGSPKRLSVSLPYMIKNLFSVGAGYPLLVFHGSDYPANGLAQLANAVPNRVYFEVVDFPQGPLGGVSPERGEQPTVCFDRHGMGYRHMCRFHSKMIYETKLLRNSDVEYVWRLDDDSMYFGQAPDVFQIMYNSKFLYAFDRIVSDPCVQDLMELTQSFAKRWELPFDWPAGRVYYNNFEVIDLTLVRSQGYQDYLNEIDRNGGIFRYRWGDAPIKTLAVQLFVQPQRVLELKDLGKGVYCHGMTCVRRG